MTAREVMDRLYPSLPVWQREANAAWLTQTARMVKTGGTVTSPRDRWVVKVVGQDDYEVIFQRKGGHHE